MKLFGLGKPEGEARRIADASRIEALQLQNTVLAEIKRLSDLREEFSGKKTALEVEINQSRALFNQELATRQQQIKALEERRRVALEPLDAMRDELKSRMQEAEDKITETLKARAEVQVAEALAIKTQEDHGKAIKKLEQMGKLAHQELDDLREEALEVLRTNEIILARTEKHEEELIKRSGVLAAREKLVANREKDIVMKEEWIVTRGTQLDKRERLLNDKTSTLKAAEKLYAKR